jgi:hypothetical protein
VLSGAHFEARLSEAILQDLTDAGSPGLIVLDLESGATWRVLQGHTSVTASRPISAEGKVVYAPDGKPVYIHADQLEVSPDGQWLYYQPCSGPLSRIETRWLDAAVSDSERAKRIETFVHTPSTGLDGPIRFLTDSSGSSPNGIVVVTWQVARAKGCLTEWNRRPRGIFTLVMWRLIPLDVAFQMGVTSCSRTTRAFFGRTHSLWQRMGISPSQRINFTGKLASITIRSEEQRHERAGPGRHGGVATPP